MSGPEPGLAPRPLPPAERDPWRPFLRTMAWVGLNTFGGPVAQIGFMHAVAVEQRRWLDDRQFVHLLDFANVLPGPEALEIAIHLGYLRRGVLGGIAAGLLFIWPGFVTLTALAWAYETYGRIGAVAGFFDGVRPVAMALVAAAAVRISRKALRGGLSYVLMTAAFLASHVLDVPFLAILAGCGLLGLALGRHRREGSDPRARAFGVSFAILVAAVVLAGRPWSSPGAAATAAASGEATAPAEVSVRRLAEVARVNTKTALVTFGGAYTALPYLREQTVDRHGWVSDAEMADALALGETTPGPLICVGVFLSYLAARLPGAIVGTVFLFLPAFVLVLGLGRYMERVENLPRAADVLWGFSAGTLGLIVALAADLVTVSVPDASSAAIAAVAFLAVWRLGASLLAVVLAGGAVGLARAALGPLG